MCMYITYNKYIHITQYWFDSTRRNGVCQRQKNYIGKLSKRNN